MGCISLDRTSFPTLMGLGASIHQSLTFFRRQHSETKSAKMVSKCYKKRGRRLYFSIDKMSVFYSSLHEILLPASMGGGSVLLFVFQRIFLDFYEKNYIVLKLRKNHSFRERFLSRKTSQTISTLQHTVSHYQRRPAHSKSWPMPLSPLFKSIHSWTEIFDIC